MQYTTTTVLRLFGFCLCLPRWADTRKAKPKPIWISWSSGSGISWAIWKIQICTSPQTDNHASTPLLSFYRPDAFPAAQPTASKYWRQSIIQYTNAQVAILINCTVMSVAWRGIVSVGRVTRMLWVWLLARQVIHSVTMQFQVLVLVKG